MSIVHQDRRFKLQDKVRNIDDEQHESMRARHGASTWGLMGFHDFKTNFHDHIFF